MGRHLQAQSEAVPAGRNAVLVLVSTPDEYSPIGEFQQVLTTGPGGMAHYAQTAAVPQRFIVAAARELARAQPGRAGVAAAARPAPSQPLL